MFEYLFGNKNSEKILFYLQRNKRCYATELSKVFNSALFGFQTTLDKLETGGLIVSQLEGKTRIYTFNPRYPFLDELSKLIEKAYIFLPAEIRSEYYENIKRTRPRRKGKPILDVE